MIYYLKSVLWKSYLIFFPRSKIKQKQVQKKKLISQQVIFDFYKNVKENCCVSRQLIDNCHDLYDFDNKSQVNTIIYPFEKDEKFKCYPCNKKINCNHPNYVFSCTDCGNLFEKYRHFSRDLTGVVSLVVGARTKIGHQVVLKLLKAGSIVIVTSRFPEKVSELYNKYDKNMIKNLYIYEKSFDLDTYNLNETINNLKDYIKRIFNHLDIIINVAAQTIRCREKQTGSRNKELNRYNDDKYVDDDLTNSWNMHLGDFEQKEMEEVYRINSIAPLLLVQEMFSLLKNSKINPYIINVHAREGIFNVPKKDSHLHTNMAKAALHMVTKCLSSCNYTTNYNKKFRIHGCDPGWISVDEYYKDNRPWCVPPLDEIDGAARILFPIFKELESNSFTRRHFYTLIN